MWILVEESCFVLWHDQLHEIRVADYLNARQPDMEKEVCMCFLEMIFFGLEKK